MPVHYHLDQFPPDNIEWDRLVPVIGRASAELARYDGLVQAIPHARVLLSPLTTQEAVLSSKIEGTNVTMGEVLEIEAGGNGATQPKRDDAEEILNYRQALTFAANSLNDGVPLSNHLLRQAHDLLMRGVRGRDKSPGAFRDGQNWIGPPGCTIEEASFVPVPQEHLLTGMDGWSNYVQSHTEPDPLVQLAIIHVEFEALHPFKDGNGRLGRMLIPLFLFARKVLSGPNFYMSGYFEARRDQYVESMQAVSRDGAWTDWCIFFLNGLIDQATENQNKARAVLALRDRTALFVARQTGSKYAASATDFFVSCPVFSITQLVEGANIPRAAALRITRVLRRDGMLKTIRRPAGRTALILAFPELINIVEGKPVL